MNINGPLEKTRLGSDKARSPQEVGRSYRPARSTTPLASRPWCRLLPQRLLHLSKQERNMIQSLDGWLNTGIDWLTRTERSSVASLPPAKRTQIILKELEGSMQKQRQAYQQLRKNLKASRKK